MFFSLRILTWKYIKMADSGDWCLIESDPGVFTQLMKDFGFLMFFQLILYSGAEGLQCDEVYDLSDTSSMSDAFGFIFLFKWEGNATQAGTPVSGEKLKSIFFAEQIIRNACATQAIINVLLNLPESSVTLGQTLTDFKSFVWEFDSKVYGCIIYIIIFLRLKAARLPTVIICALPTTASVRMSVLL